MDFLFDIENAVLTTGADRFFGSAGDNVVRLGAGADIAYGGAGIDTIDLTDVFGAAVVDLVNRTTDDGSGAIDFVFDFENVRLAGGNDRFFGDGFANRVTMGGGDDVGYGGGGDDVLLGDAGNDTLFGDVGNDTLEGGANDDVLTGGTGADILRGGDGNDTYNVSDALDTISDTAGVDTVVSAVDFTLGADVEILRLVGTAVSGTGNSAANTIIGNAVGNVIAGLGGDDRIFGEGGNDVIAPGLGADIVYGGADVDTLDYSSATAGVMVNLGSRWATDDGGSFDAVFEFENAILSAFADRFFGDAGANRVALGAGNDIAYGGVGRDVLDYSAATGAIFADLANRQIGETALTSGTVSATTGRLSTDFVFEFEDLIATSFGDRIFASALTVSIDAGGGDDIVYGGASTTSILGGAGNDVLVAGAAGTVDGGLGNDLIYGSAGADMLAGGGGFDRFMFRASEGPFGADRITDFLAGDLIDLRGWGLTYANLVFTNPTPGSTTISAAALGTNTITLDSVIVPPTASAFLF